LSKSRQMNTFSKIEYKTLNAKQQENYNFHKLASELANYGFNSIRLSDDWLGADFIAYHIDAKSFMRVQLKGRLYFNKKYIGKDLFLAFREEEGHWYLYPHDHLLSLLLQKGYFLGTSSWDQKGEYHFPKISSALRAIISEYKLG
jgi:hypothetical protein